jgi:hypothetical protein
MNAKHLVSEESSIGHCIQNQHGHKNERQQKGNYLPNRSLVVHTGTRRRFRDFSDLSNLRHVPVQNSSNSFNNLWILSKVVGNW